MANLTSLSALTNLTIPPPTEPTIIGKQLIQPSYLNLADFITLFCAHSIINAHGDRESIFLYHYHDDVVQRLQMESRMVFNLNIPQSIYHNRPMNFLVFIVDNILIIKSYLEQTYYTKYFNTYAKFLVIYRGTPHRYVEVFELFNSYRLSQIVVMTIDYNVYGVVRKCFNQFEMPKLLFNCQARNVSSILEVYDRRVAVKGCTIKVLALKAAPYVKFDKNIYTGLTINVLKEAATQYGFSLDYVDHNQTVVGYQLEDTIQRHRNNEACYEGLLGLLDSKQGDVAVGMITTNYTHSEDFGATIAFLESYYMFYMTPYTTLQERDKTSSVFDAITLQIYFATIACYIFLVYLLLLMFNLYNPEHYNEFSYTFVQLWGIGTARAVKQPKGISLRIIFISWAFFTYIFTCSYETTLTSFLMQPPQVNPVQSMENMVKHNLRPVGSARNRDAYFRNRDDPIYELIYNKWEETDDIRAFMLKNWHDANFAVFMDKKRFNSDFKGMDYFFDRFPVFQHFVWMVVSKGSGFESLLNTIILQVMSTGLLDKWSKDHSYYYTYKGFSGGFVPLRLVHFTATWWIYIGGVCGSIVVFFIENAYYYKWGCKLLNKITK